MTPAPFRLVILVEILETSAEAWWRLASMTGQLMVRLEGSLPPMEQIIETLAELHRECGKLDLPLSQAHLDRFRDGLSTFANLPLPIVAARMRDMVVELNMRVWDELKSRFFLSIPSESVAYYRPATPLFGPAVEAKFSRMSEDISEAGKCLALNRSTAAVFHLMRIMELAVQGFGNKLGIALASEKNWQNILDEINKAIKALDPKTPQTKAFAGASAHLYNVKICWRNEVMHPKQTYTPDEARDVFAAVQTFIRDLAGIL